jgi:hypothetical protein
VVVQPYLQIPPQPSVCAGGKRVGPSVAAFHFNLEPELWTLHEELTTKTYRPGAYRSFFIHEPKPRQISAAPYRGNRQGSFHSARVSSFFWVGTNSK